MQKLFEGAVQGYRCETLYFVAPSNHDLSPFTLQIDSLREVLHEGTGCERYLGEVKAALDKNNIPIEFDCIEDHGYMLEITHKPDRITEEEALQLLYDYYRVEGNWQFTFGDD